MSTESLLIHGSAWLTGAAYTAALAGRLRRGVWTAGARRLWLGGALLLLGHFALSFHWRHGWSHAAAVAATAAQTKSLTGVDWGGGVWLNYFLALVWLADALWLCLASSHHAHRPRWASAAIHAYLAFLWFNATIVFGAGPARLFGIACLLLIAGAAASKRKRLARPGTSHRRG